MEGAGIETYFYRRYSLLKAAISMFPSLMSSLMNLFVLSSSISWHVMRSLKSGLSRNESVNSSVGSPMVPGLSSHTSDSAASPGALTHIAGGFLQPGHLSKLLLLLHFLTSACVVAAVVWLLLVRLGGGFVFVLFCFMLLCFVVLFCGFFCLFVLIMN